MEDFFSPSVAYEKDILLTEEMAFKHALKLFLNYYKTLKLIVTKSTPISIYFLLMIISLIMSNHTPTTESLFIYCVFTIQDQLHKRHLLYHI